VPQAVSARILEAAARPFAHRRLFLALLAVYAVAQVALRVALSPALGRDELIEAIVAQGWALGYNPTQPPLYTWLIVAAQELVGPGALAHALVKWACLFLAYLFFFLAAERAIGSTQPAALATASWMLTYMFGYDVTQGNYTQSVALLAICSALLYVALRMRSAAGWGSYLALGLLIGLGTLAKYGFGVFALTLLAAGLLDAKLRRALLDWRLLAAAAIALVLVAPHVLWLKFGPPMLRGAFTGALQVGWKGGYWPGVGAGLASILRSSFDFLAPAVVLWAVLFWRAFLARAPWKCAACSTAGCCCPTPCWWRGCWSPAPPRSSTTTWWWCCCRRRSGCSCVLATRRSQPGGSRPTRWPRWRAWRRCSRWSPIAGWCRTVAGAATCNGTMPASARSCAKPGSRPAPSWPTTTMSAATCAAISPTRACSR